MSVIASIELYVLSVDITDVFIKVLWRNIEGFPFMCVKRSTSEEALYLLMSLIMGKFVIFFQRQPRS